MTTNELSEPRWVRERRRDAPVPVWHRIGDDSLNTLCTRDIAELACSLFRSFLPDDGMPCSACFTDILTRRGEDTMKGFRNV